MVLLRCCRHAYDMVCTTDQKVLNKNGYFHQQKGVVHTLKRTMGRTPWVWYQDAPSSPSFPALITAIPTRSNSTGGVRAAMLRNFGPGGARRRMMLSPRTVIRRDGKKTLQLHLCAVKKKEQLQ